MVGPCVKHDWAQKKIHQPGLLREKFINSKSRQLKKKIRKRKRKEKKMKLKTFRRQLLPEN